MRNKLGAFITCLALMGFLTWIVCAQENLEQAVQPEKKVKKVAKKAPVPPEVKLIDWSKIPSKKQKSKPVRQPDGRLSPNTTPAFPNDAQKYDVVKGDTLWRISGEYLTSCYLWPNLWEKNMHVKNPHWIYPGDQLLVGTVKLVDRAPEAVVEERPICERTSPFKDALERLKAGVKKEEEAQQLRLTVDRVEAFYGMSKELYGTGVVYDHCPKFKMFIVGAENEDSMRNLPQGQVVYINQGKDDVKVGDRFSVIRSAGEIRHPEKGYKVGYYFKQLGTVKVLITRDKHSVAVIDWSAQPLYIGDALVPFKDHDLIKKDFGAEAKFTPLGKDFLTSGKEIKEYVRFTTDNDKPKGRVVFIEDKCRVAGTGNVVYIDLGKEKNLSPGQRLTVYEKEGEFRYGSEYYPDFSTYFYKERRAKKFQREAEEELEERHIPRVVLGELVVIDVFEKTAKAVVVQSRVPVNLGSRVQVQ
ncbi:MAG: LysM peptidoglycan-binding domain-containing protein [Acidobacteria bacterium]|nr:LysM peptidoglycan-binding domain-containing protein [Acidobacteriota bacterium]